MKFKKINTKEKTFYIFETSSISFSIFDSKLDFPIYNGSWNMCEGIIKNIKKHIPTSSIYYYVCNKNGIKLNSFWSYNI